MKIRNITATLMSLCMCILIAGCGGGGGRTAAPAPVQQPAPPPVSVSVSPGSVMVESGATQQFTATVTNDSSNAGVTWLVQDCFSNPCGVIDGAGKYTAPGSGVIAPYSVTVRATSKADPTRSATAAVQVLPLPAKVFLSPSRSIVAYGKSLSFRTTVNPPGATTRIDWSLSGTDCVGEGCGILTQAGNYTAPPSPAGPFDVTVVARVHGHPEIEAQATVRVQPENPDIQKLQGTYVFYLNGFDGDGMVTFAGLLKADGQGHITDATIDSLSDWGSFTFPHVSGSYSVFADDRALLVLDLPWLANEFSVSLRSIVGGVATRGRLAVLDPTSWGFSGSGWIAKQEADALSADPLSGDYAFGLQGSGTKGSFLAYAAGRFTIQNGNLVAGQFDVNDGGGDLVHQTLSGTVTIGPEGRGTLTTQPLGTFFIYVISKDEFALLHSDMAQISGRVTLGGSGLRQLGAPLTLATMAGPAVLSLSHRDRALLAQMTMDANGAFEGSFDTFQGEQLLAHDDGVPGTFSLDSDLSGRGTFQRIGETVSYVLYATGPRSGFILASNGLTGTLEAQDAGPFDAASLNGDFSIGVLPTPGMYYSSSFATGALSADGQGLLSGVIDNYLGNGLDFARPYSISGNGRMVVSWEAPDPDPSMIGPSSRIFYLISPEKAVGISQWSNAAGPVSFVSTVSILEKK